MPPVAGLLVLRDVSGRSGVYRQEICPDEASSTTSSTILPSYLCPPAHHVIFPQQDACFALMIIHDIPSSLFHSHPSLFFQFRPQRWSIFRAMRRRWFIFQQRCNTDYFWKSLTSPSSRLFSLTIGNDYFSIILLILGLIILGLPITTQNHPCPPHNH